MTLECDPRDCGGSCIFSLGIQAAMAPACRKATGRILNNFLRREGNNRESPQMWRSRCTNTIKHAQAHTQTHLDRERVRERGGPLASGIDCRSGMKQLHRLMLHFLVPQMDHGPILATSRTQLRLKSCHTFLRPKCSTGV